MRHSEQYGTSRMYIDESLCVLRGNLLYAMSPEQYTTSRIELYQITLTVQNCITCVISSSVGRGGGLGSRPKKMYGERLGDGVEYHLMSPTPHR